MLFFQCLSLEDLGSAHGVSFLKALHGGPPHKGDMPLAQQIKNKLPSIPIHKVAEEEMSS